MTQIKSGVERCYAKHVFLDVVSFSQRSAEAQSDIVQSLNEIVHKSLELCGVSVDQRILIPTGDGVCISLDGRYAAFDCHIRLAACILGLLQDRNKNAEDQSRAFEVRVGLNQNTDIIVMDVNDRRNIAGDGINMASRVMGKADGGQILLTHSVYDELRPSERYREKFRQYDTQVKHGLLMPVYQYVDSECPGLDCGVPREFRVAEVRRPSLLKWVAYYMAHAIVLRDFVISHQGMGQQNYSIEVMLWFLARDSVGASEATDTHPYSPCVFGGGRLDVVDVFSHYQSQDFRIVAEVASQKRQVLGQYSECLTRAKYGVELLFVTDAGVERLRSEWPGIWSEMKLGEVGVYDG